MLERLRKGALMVAGWACILAFPTTHAAAEQQFPSRSVVLIVPARPSSTTALVGRLFGDALSRELGRPVLLRYKPGENGNVGHFYATRARPDGHTLVLTFTGPLSINHLQNSDVDFDPLKDFTHLGMIASSANLLVVRAGAPWKTLEELVEYAKRHPGKLKYATAGSGTSSHLLGEFLKAEREIHIVHTRFKDGAEGLMSVVSGHTDMTFYHLASALPYVQAGKLRALAVSSASPSTLLPHVKPLAQQGSSSVSVSGWWGIAGPANMPADVSSRLVRAVETTTSSQPFRSRLADLGLEPITMSQEQYVHFVSGEMARWRPMVELIGPQAD